MNDGQSKPDAKHVWGVQECQKKTIFEKKHNGRQGSQWQKS